MRNPLEHYPEPWVVKGNCGCKPAYITQSGGSTMEWITVGGLACLIWAVWEVAHGR